MLDLEAIFNPDVIEAELAARQRRAARPVALDIGPDDLPGDLRVEFEERAAIKEYDGGMPRERAEAEALAEIADLMRNTGTCGGPAAPVTSKGDDSG